MIIPPFSGVTLVQYDDRIELTPVYWYREIVGLGRINSRKVRPQENDPFAPFFQAATRDSDIWVVAQWKRYDDGREEAVNLIYLDADATETEARKTYDGLVEFLNADRSHLEEISKLFKASDDDLAYIEDRHPKATIGAPASGKFEEHDVYQARLRVFAGMQPQTVSLIQKAEAADSAESRAKFEREAVQAYFAEMAHNLTEDDVLAWQKTNPVGTKWLCEFSRVLSEPEKEIDPINYELALNWIRKGYNLLTAEELSDKILVRTGQRMMSATLKKRRERLGLTSKRPTGPRPNSES